MPLNREELFNYLFISLGSLLLAFGVVGFLEPNEIATGGTAGMAIVLHQIINLPIGVLMALINLPLLFVGLKYLGNKFALKTIICIFLIVCFVDLLAEVIQLEKLSDDLLLATLYGGISVGMGLGLIFRGGASAGGGTILAKIITQRTNFKTSTVVLILDATVVITAGIVFKSVELALWSIISLYVSSKLIDLVLLGARTQKIVHISSPNNLHGLSAEIKNELGISGTIVTGGDIGVENRKDIIFLVIDKNRISALKKIIKEHDSNVKMIVMEASEIL